MGVAPACSPYLAAVAETYWLGGQAAFGERTCCWTCQAAQPDPLCPGAIGQPEAASERGLVRRLSASSPLLRPRLRADCGCVRWKCSGTWLCLSRLVTPAAVGLHLTCCYLAAARPLFCHCSNIIFSSFGVFFVPSLCGSLSHVSVTCHTNTPLGLSVKLC